MSVEKTTYDELPYSSYAHEQSHPDTLATIGRMFGLSPAPVERCRVLELGCGSGGNLIPMAFNLTRSQFVGIDLSGHGIQEGRRIIGELGLSNIQLERRNILEIGQDIGRFDYILCHGVYSWVDKNTQRRILDLCRERLEPHGVAYVSYNVYPGWHLPEMLRGMMRYYTAGIERAGDKATLVRPFLSTLRSVAEITEDDRAQFLRSELSRLENSDDSYLFHEYLVEHNQPIYFHQFVERAAQAGLKYLGDSLRETMLVDSQPEPFASFMRRCRDVVEAQQYLDFFLNRRFRYSLLCLQERELDLNLKPEIIFELSFRAGFDPCPALLDPRESPVVLTATATGLSVSVTGEALRVALAVLAEVAPQVLSFRELLARTVSRLRAAPWPSTPPPDPDTPEGSSSLAAHLTRLYFAGILYCHSYSAQVIGEVTSRPQTTRLARLEVQQKRTATSQWHRHLFLNPVESALVGRLDGSRDRAELEGELVHIEGMFGGASSSQEPGETDLTHRLDRFLEKLRVNGFLVG